MRIDKYLKTARVIKRRSIAKEACDQGKVTVNGKSVKAGYEVKVGDKIEIDFGPRVFKGEVLELTEHVTKESSREMYRTYE